MSKQQLALIAAPPYRATSTKEAYLQSWNLFERFCKERLYKEVEDPDALIAWIQDRSDTRSYATLRKDLHAIAAHLVDSGYPDPRRNKAVQKAMGNALKTAVPARAHKKAVLTAGIKAVLEILREPKATEAENLRALRDSVALLFCFGAALKRDELRNLNVEHIIEVAGGLQMRVQASDDAKVRDVTIESTRSAETDPVRYYRLWLKTAGIRTGAVFRPIKPDGVIGAERMAARTVSKVLKERLEAAGLPGSLVSPHSLRRGHIAQAAADGYTLDEIAAQTGHTEELHIKGLFDRARGQLKRNSSGILAL